MSALRNLLLLVALSIPAGSLQVDRQSVVFSASGQPFQPRPSSQAANFGPNGQGTASQQRQFNAAAGVASGVASGGSKVLAAEPMLGFALKLGDCQSSSAFDCASNTVFSPLSITSTLTLLLSGTKGACYTQLRKALRYHANAQDAGINSAYKYIMTRMKRLDRDHGSDILLNVANGIFSQSPLNEDYSRQAKDFFLSEVRQLDLQGNAFGSANVINKWVSDQTNGKIPSVLLTLPPDTRLVAANAVYFKAKWSDPFDPQYTRSTLFTISPQETITVPTMFGHLTVPYVDDVNYGCKMIGIPYKGEELAMYLLLPTGKDGIESLNRLEEQLDEFKLQALIDRMESKTTSVQLPKFQIRQRVSLKNSLKALGVVDLFDPSSADLSRMTSRQGSALDDIIHQTYIDVNEAGTEAAAATVVSLSRDGPSKSFVADRPFRFFIIDLDTRAVLFTGRVVRPGGGGRN